MVPRNSSLAVVATNRHPGTSSTASSFTAVRKSDAVAREDSPTPRPQDGTLDVAIAPSSPAAVTPRADSAVNSCTAASFDAGVRGSDMTDREFFPRLAHKTANCISELRLLCPLL